MSYFHSKVVCNKITIKLVNRCFMILVEDLSDLDETFPSCIMGEIPIGLLVKYDRKNACHHEISQYKILSSIVAQYIPRSRNTTLNCTKMIRYMPWIVD
jgi:hypothetical protein